MGDEILRVNDKSVSSAEDIISVLEVCEVGTAAKVTVRRKGAIIDLSVELAARAE